MGRMSETHEAKTTNESRSTSPRGDAFLHYISQGWADREPVAVVRREVADFAADRRRALAAQFPKQRLVIAAGVMKQRSNDTFFQFRAHSAFAHLTGWGSDAEPGSVLVLDPSGDAGHRATLFFREGAGRDSDEFFANPEIGEFWIGARPSLEQVSIELGIETAPLDTFTAQPGDVTLENDDLARAASELRLVKDEFEKRQMQIAVDATARGFTDVLAALDDAMAAERGERVIEGVFNQRARLEGNTVGYETIAAAGSHACILHWTRNSGDVRSGDLLLLDAGIELDSLYTADITRTIPVSGTFTPVQRQVYEAVLEAADAARAIVRPGIRFGDVHDEAMRIIAERTREWGFPLAGTIEGASTDQVTEGEEALPHHRRYMVHGTSHHLGLDVHDCAQARREMYLDGIVEAGMCFTIEPGLYFQPDDLTVPEEFRGIGVRIEDNILVTESGCVNLSADIPRTADDVEEWISTAKASRSR